MGSRGREGGCDAETKLGGRTPWKFIEARIYLDIRDNPSTVFEQASSRPPRFRLKGSPGAAEPAAEEPEPPRTRAGRFVERDLHPLLVSYVAGDPHFQGHTKTIYHESSTKAGRNSERWMHPDLVSVRFPFGEMDQAVTELGRSTGAVAVSLYSFEMKVRVTGSDVRECFFQAVSNSSWANEGYLVALDYTEDALDQLSRLSPSFGIGAIRLDAGDVHQSEALFPARRRGALDFGIIDDLLRINPGFRSFVEAVNSSMRAGRAVESDYDEVMDDERLAGWVREKGIAAGRR